MLPAHFEPGYATALSLSLCVFFLFIEPVLLLTQRRPDLCRPRCLPP